MVDARNLPAKVTPIDLAPASAPMDVMTLAQMFVKSGYFTDVKDVAQAVVKIVAGQEVGLGPMASLMGIYIVQGKPSWSANLMATQIRNSRRYDYRIVELSDTACELEFLQGKQSLGTSRFTLDDARKAGLANKEIWKSYPRNMLFARAMSNGCRWYCADVFGGVTPYTPEELNSNVPADDLRPVGATVPENPPVDLQNIHPEEGMDDLEFDEPASDADESRRLDLLTSLLERADAKGPQGRANLRKWWELHYPDDADPEKARLATVEAAYALVTAKR